MRFLKTAALYLTGVVTVCAQAPAPPGVVVGVGTFIHVVANLDKTMRFYGDRLGLELNGAPGPRAFSTNAVVEKLYDASGSQSRVAVFKIQGSPLGLEFAEFKDAGQKPVRPRIQDPGASILALPVRDIESVMAKLKEDGTPVIGDAIVEDPDGFFIQLVESGPHAKLFLTIDSTDRTLRVFSDLLGFQPQPGTSFSDDQERLKALGLRNASYRGTTAKVPGTELEVEFVEFKGIDRRPHPAGIHDTGAGVLRLLVRDVDTLLPALKAAGVPVVSVGGDAVSVGNRRAANLRDPDNFFFQIMSQPIPAPK